MDVNRPNQTGTVDSHTARNTGQWCCGSLTAPSGRFLLVAGSTPIGGLQHAAGQPWDAIDLVSTSGAVSVDGVGSGTGSASAVIRFTKTVDGRLYQVDRTLTYTYPNTFISDSYRVTIPSGNAVPVKLYYGGDSAPGGSDVGYGIQVTSPRRSIISLNPSSELMFGFREVPGSVPFAGAQALSYSASALQQTALAGGDIGYGATTSNHDATQWVQWNLGSEPGEVTAGMEVFVTPQGLALSAGFRDSAIVVGNTTSIDFSIVNTNLTETLTGSFQFALPAGITVGAATVTNSCTGTASATAGSNTVSVTGAQLAPEHSCSLSVPTDDPAAGVYSVSSASVTSATGLNNEVGASTLTVGTAPVWTTTELEGFQVGASFEAVVSASGQPAPTYSVAAGALPTGVSIDPVTGAVTGTPTTAGAYSFTLRAENAIGSTTHSYTGTVAPPATPPVWSDQQLASFKVGVAYADGVLATGIPAPTYLLFSGQLPDGITLVADSGVVEGTPTVAGSFTFVLRASNASGDIDASFTVDVEPADAAPTWVDETIGVPLVGVLFEDQVAATGYPAPTYALADGDALPAGLSLDPLTGAIAGTPTVAGPFEFTIEASNGVGTPATATLTGEVVAAPVWTDQLIPALALGVAVSDGVSASGYPAPTYSVTAGALPAGLTLNPTTGTIVGTPSVFGPFSATVAASNGIGDPISTVLSGVVVAAPWWLDDVIGTVQAGQSFSDGVSASGYPAPTYSVTAGALPAGLTLDPTTGSIVGTPTTPGPFSVTIRAANSHGAVTIRLAASVAPVATQPLIGADLGAGLPAGAPVPVGGAGLQPGSAVEVQVDGVVVGTATVGPDGTISLDITLPDGDQTGLYELVLSGTSATGEPVRFADRILVDWSGTAHRVPGADTGYQPLTPRRVHDSRDGVKFAAGELRRIPITSEWGVPDGATSVVLNVTVTQPSAAGYVTAYPCGIDRPLASAVNFGAEDTIANLVVVDTGTLNEVCIYSLVDAHVVVDLNGAFGPGVGSHLSVDVPTRIVDTRTTTKLQAGQVLEVPVRGAVDGAAAATGAVLNVTVTEPGAAGYVTLFPCGMERPLASNVNFRADQTIANQAFVKLSDEGTVCVFTMVEAHVVIDLAGTFETVTDTQLVTFAPVRLVDTRTVAPLDAGQTVQLVLSEHGGLPGASALALNVTVTEPGAAGYVTLFPCGMERPLASNVNFQAGQTVANHTTAMLSVEGTVCLYASAATHVVIDVEGAYV
ncbi:MAG TPA: Ig domain-containing protein [Ilumatobacter sp.]|nr:Ig domain-containing protein [Ilumatobacter sp.]